MPTPLKVIGNSEGEWDPQKQQFLKKSMKLNRHGGEGCGRGAGVETKKNSRPLPFKIYLLSMDRDNLQLHCF